MQPVSMQLKAPDGQTIEARGELVQFSAYQCFPMTGEPAEVAILRRLVDTLASHGVALYRSGPFIDFLAEHAPEILAHTTAVIDPDDVRPFHNLPVIASADGLPDNAVLICEPRAEVRNRIARRLPPRCRVITLDDAGQFTTLVPPHAWIARVPSIYPIATPEIAIRPGVDFLLLNTPAGAGEQIPVGLCYVQAALERQRVDFQTVDANMIFYHRFHMHRLFDLGHEPLLAHGIAISTDAWGYNERIWVDPRQWPFLLAHFADTIDELVGKIVAAAPRVLGMSIHQRNEWITREIARRVKQAAPDIQIVVGGHSCYSEPFGRGAFPEHDYMVIGEADLVIGPLAEKLIAGERPKNLPGVISQHDDGPFLPGPQPHNLDMLGGLVGMLSDDVNVIYQTWQGYKSTALPLTRGCVWSRCTFCAERFAFRTRTASNYVDEMEAVMATGRGGQFSASDSDFGGRPETLYEICEEILRRGIKVQFGGQIRLNKKFDVPFFKLMKAAGVTGLNFGADAFTENTIKQQMKGYTLDTLIQNHRDCATAGVTPQINIVIGVPGETDQDMLDTIALLGGNRDCFPVINNINVAMLVQNSVYWFQPDKFNIHFYGDREENLPALLFRRPGAAVVLDRAIHRPVCQGGSVPEAGPGAAAGRHRDLG